VGKSLGIMGLQRRNASLAKPTTDHLHYSGATLHLLGALHQHGKMGATCIADSREEADALYERVDQTIDELRDSRA
jgi:hypothetical protein